MHKLLLAFILTSLFVLPCGAADYRGADAVLAEALQATSKTNVSQPKVSPATQMKEDLKAFARTSTNLPPAQAATQWLVLFDRLYSLKEQPSGSGYRQGAIPRVQDLLGCLPPPAGWPELARMAEARQADESTAVLRNLALRMVVHTLNGDVAKRQADLKAVEALAAKIKGNQSYVFSAFFDELGRAMMETLENPELLLQMLERKVSESQSSERSSSNLEIPDLVALVGPEKAEAFLRKALTRGAVPLSVEAGAATAALAQKLALELVDQLKVPQWGLVQSIDSVALYEAMDKKFSKPEATEPTPAIPGLPALPPTLERFDGFERENAKVFYFLGLIAQRRTTNAVAVARQFQRDADFPRETLRALERAGLAGELSSFLHELLRTEPEIPLWDEYVRVAANAGDTGPMVALVREAQTKPGLSKGMRSHLQQLLYKALLANDEIDPAIAELKLCLERPTTASGNRRYSEDSRLTLALRLAEIGLLLGRTNWIDQGLAIAVLEEQKPEDENVYYDSSGGRGVADLLMKLNRGPEAEQILGQRLAAMVQKEKEQVEPRRYMGPSQSGRAVPILISLVKLYYKAGRYADVMKVFEEAPYWGVGDLSEMRHYNDPESYSWRSGNRMVTVPVGFYAAAAMAKTGRENEARKLLGQLLDQSQGCDRLYELLLELEPEPAVGQLDALFERDQFEERPLVWKAHWLREHQRLPEAERAARQAISIDPTDGEQPPGDRLRAYAELAEIRAALGDPKEAAMLRSAVEAVHQAEKADEFQEVGLLKRAVGMYEGSLHQFADAYCIHARLAVQLSDMGRHQEAEEHYRRAYELMPESFGRVESHCFGCERAFDGERAQSIAEKVFARLAKETPNKPQVHYMLGFLREEQNRFAEALESFRAAVKLDPDYLNAWSKIESIRSHVSMPAAERDAVVFNILRLDPFQRRGGISLESVTDLARLWDVVAAANARRPAKPASLLVFPATKARLEKQRAAADTSAEVPDFPSGYPYSDDRLLTPSGAVARNAFIRAAQDLMESQGGLDY